MFLESKYIRMLFSDSRGKKKMEMEMLRELNGSVTISKGSEFVVVHLPCTKRIEVRDCEKHIERRREGKLNASRNVKRRQQQVAAKDTTPKTNTRNDESAVKIQESVNKIGTHET